MCRWQGARLVSQHLLQLLELLLVCSLLAQHEIELGERLRRAGAGAGGWGCGSGHDGLQAAGRQQQQQRSGSQCAKQHRSQQPQTRAGCHVVRERVGLDGRGVQRERERDEAKLEKEEKKE